jgi:hypothetical protein
MSLLGSTFTGKLKGMGSIDGRTVIPTVELLLKDGKKVKVFGKSQASMKNQINMKEIMLMITSMALANSIGPREGISPVSISMTLNLGMV